MEQIEQFTPRNASSESVVESTELFAIDTAHRINALVTAADEIVDASLSTKELLVNGSLAVVEMWHDGYWKGVSLTSAKVLRDADGKIADYGNRVVTSLQRHTDGRSKIDVDGYAIDNSGMVHASNVSFEISPIWQHTQHEVEGTVYDFEEQKVSPIRVNARESVEGLLATAEKTILAIQRHRQERASQPEPDEIEAVDARPPFSTLPLQLERPVTRALQLGTLMETAERLAAACGTDDGYLSGGRFYSFGHKQTKQGEHALLHWAEVSNVDSSPDEPFDYSGGETYRRLSRSRGGTFCVAVDVKKVDEHGNTRKGSDRYLFSQQRDHIEHTGTGFSFDPDTGAYRRNKDITDQAELADELQRILDDTQTMLEDLIDDVDWE